MRRCMTSADALDCSLHANLRSFRYVITGMLNKQIALKLGIAEKTVKVHRGRIMEKLRVDSVAELVRLAEKAGINPAEK